MNVSKRQLQNVIKLNYNILIIINKRTLGSKTLNGLLLGK